MPVTPSLLERVRFYCSTVSLYLATISFIGIAALAPAAKPHHVLAMSQPRYTALAWHTKLVAGVPVRIVLPDSHVDLPVDPGYYDPTTGDWTLTGYHAQYAMISSLANNIGGETFIYGHNNNYVFGALRHVTPSPGAPALIYASNGHIFQYVFVSSDSVAPNDTTSLDYKGPPIMTIQTCTGSLNEWRTMYRYNFVKVVQ